MKKVEKLISKEKYIEIVTPLIREEVLKGISESKSKQSTKASIASRNSYWIVAFLFKITGIIMFITGILPLIIHGPIDTYNPASEVTIILIGVGAGIWIIGWIMILIRKMTAKEVGTLFGENMDREKIYKIAIDSFPNFSLYDINYDEIRHGLYDYNNQIPSDATISEFSPSFLVKYKDKYIVQLQSAKFNWTRDVQDGDDISTETFYETAGFIKLEGDKRNTDFLYTMNQTSPLKKIDLENKEFLKMTKYRSNNEIKSRMAFTPLAMEEIVKHLSKSSTAFELTKEEQKYVFSMMTSENCYVINAKMGKTVEKTVQNFIDDIIEDFYGFYEAIGVALIPPML